MALLDTLKSGLKSAGNAVLGAVAPGATAVKNVISGVTTAAKNQTQAKSAASLAPTPATTKTTLGPYVGEPASSYATGKPIGMSPVTNVSSGTTTKSGAAYVPPATGSTPSLAPAATPAPTTVKAPASTAISGSNPFGGNYTASTTNDSFANSLISSSPATSPVAQAQTRPTPAPVAPTAPAQSTQPAQPSELEMRRKALQEALLGTYQQTEAERQSQQALQRLAEQQAQLSGAFRSGTNKIGEQPIVLGLLRGQQQALQKQYEGEVGALADQAKPLEVQLANLLANREQQNKALSTEYGFLSDEQKRQDALSQAAEAEGFTLGEGQMRYDAQGNLIARGGEKSVSTPASIQEYQFAQQQGFQGGYLDYVKAKDQATTTSSSTPSSYKEWELAGQPGTYADWVTKSSKPATADQYNAALFAQRGATSSDIINQLGSQFTGAQSIIGGALPNVLKSSERQQFDQATRDFINAVLRRESGAAIADTEFDSARKQYIPQPGDSAEVLAQKANNRNLAVTGIQRAAGSAAFGSTSSGGDELDNILGNLGFKNAQSGALNSSGIGSLSAKYESGGNPGAIGYDSTGGYSYGTYQLAHNNAQKFVAESPYAQQFAGIPFNSAKFQQKWKEIAQKDPQGFANAQHKYIEKTHLSPIISRLSQKGIDVNKLSPIVKDVMWSTAVQHGPGTRIIEQAMATAQNEQDFIKKVYQLRWNNGAGFASSTPAVQKSVYNRFFGPNGELAQALSRTTA